MAAFVVFFTLFTAVAFGQLTTSGISSGGYAANQYHVAHSAEVSGAAIIAAGPYYCSLANLATASTACVFMPELIDMDLLYAATDYAEALKSIDPTSNLQGAKVLVWSGTKDEVENPGVVAKVVEYYNHYQADVLPLFNYTCVHSMVTDNWGWPCLHFESPFINNCNVSLAGLVFEQMYGPLQPRVPMLPQNLFEIPQKEFVPFHDPSIFTSLDDIAYVYYPSACSRHSNATDVKGSRLESTTNCSRIHVAFHGCLQNLPQVNTSFVEHGGYLEWAEANNIVVLFPQVIRDDALNPMGCWDWWGYSGLDFATKLGIQIATVEAMVKWL